MILSRNNRSVVKWFEIIVFICPREARVSIFRVCCEFFHIFGAEKLNADFSKLRKDPRDLKQKTISRVSLVQFSRDPVVSVYRASRAQLEEKSSLLCVASAMFPPLVQISWKKQKGSGPLQDAHPAKAKRQELRESGCSASILTIPLREYNTYKYLCSVQHEGGTVTAQTEIGNEGLVFAFSSDSASCGDDGLVLLSLSVGLRFVLQTRCVNTRVVATNQQVAPPFMTSI
uniref:Ig-like domain-containing protein n=1 Tax=Labrus bergylta TaxID=56723 RepID=A0A3Q3NJM1_9LABR